MSSPSIELDALIIGAGFGGVYELKRLRDEGFTVKMVESGSDCGGVWYWNRYPGARVDSPIPHYEFSDESLWADWTWKQRFPGSAEIRDYFQYVADKWDLRKDSIFNTYVDSAVWDDDASRWTISTRKGPVFKAKFFLPNTGFAARRHIPDSNGLETFEGTWMPRLIGTGSTGIQLTQDLAPLAKDFTLFQRKPNLALPMKQIDFVGTNDQTMPRDKYADLYAIRKQSYGGFDYSFMPTGTFEHDESQRRETYEQLWQHGDFHFWLATYQDMLFADDANTEAYNFWRDKVRARVADPKLKDQLAPLVKPHAFGCKRISLENGYYELLNEQHVHLVDVNETPIAEVTPSGIKTSDGKEHDFDIIVCATGYDALTGGLLDMNVVGQNGVRLSDKWADGVKTYLGLCVSGFPNMFFTYGPQAPTALCNGPFCAELQGDWVVNALKALREKKLNTINASLDAEKTWAEGITAIANMSLLPTTKSWYMGDNIPGKRREPLIYLGGVPTYYKTITESTEKGYEGFHLG